MLMFSVPWCGQPNGRTKSWLIRGLSVLLLAVTTLQAKEFDAGMLSFEVHLDGHAVNFNTYFVSLQPLETLDFHVTSESRTSTYYVESLAPQAGGEETDPHGTLKHRGDKSWSWKAPRQSGLYPLRITREGTGEAMLLQVFVEVPAERMKNGVLNGYVIGAYPKPRAKSAIDFPPKGYIEVTSANENTWITPHFQLKQFLCKQSGSYPKYLVLLPRLLTKLEILLQDVNRRGQRADSFVVMSGYRTPHYNQMLGNVKYGRHLWGSAADIYVDVSPRDGRMDDLNGDGRVSRADATWLYRVADEFQARHPHLNLEGGVGEYDSTAAHGPFVHVDVRGEKARWGHSGP